MYIRSENKVRLEEVNIIAQAEEDFILYGKTEVKCPRCGGELNYNDYGGGYILSCEREECIKKKSKLDFY